MSAMAEAIEVEVATLGDPAGLGDGVVELLELRSEVACVEVDEGPRHLFSLEELEPVEVVTVSCRFRLSAGGVAMEGTVALAEYRRPIGSGDGWRDHEQARADVLGALAGFLLGEGVARPNVVEALRNLQEFDSHLLTPAA